MLNLVNSAHFCTILLAMDSNIFVKLRIYSVKLIFLFNIKTFERFLKIFSEIIIVRNNTWINNSEFLLTNYLTIIFLLLFYYFKGNALIHIVLYRLEKTAIKCHLFSTWINLPFAMHQIHQVSTFICYLSFNNT